MRLTLTTPPQVEPVELGDMKDHLRLEVDTDDALVEGLIRSARSYIENTKLSRALITQTWVAYFDAFPFPFIELPRPPLLTVTGITYLDTAGDRTTWDSSNYVVDVAREPGRVELAYNESYPTARFQANSIELTFTAGYGPAPADVPFDILLALKQIVAQWYELREPVVVGTIVAKIPDSANALLASHRVLRV